jgi:D-beta-D-heptose 7-phosphate kinase/D-beta-D-heptose 1-phosphate adenosyltransferase
MGITLALPDLQEERARLRQADRLVVFTNGCFDLVHPGHVRYLDQARKLGDALIVALNSDRAVAQLKGSGRPILNEAERSEVIAALASVDYVTVFDDISPLGTIKALMPDILVKGADWGVDEIVGKDEVEAAGGKVLTIPFVDGLSTTQLIERIRGRSKQ